MALYSGNTPRKRGSDSSGSAFTFLGRLAVWQKGVPVTGYDPAMYRKDTCGAWMDWSKYGDTTPGGLGWEIDHILPVSKGGTDDLANLQPLQWQNNRSKGDDYPRFFCELPKAA